MTFNLKNRKERFLYEFTATLVAQRLAFSGAAFSDVSDSMTRFTRSVRDQEIYSKKHSVISIQQIFVDIFNDQIRRARSQEAKNVSKKKISSDAVDK